MSHQRPNSSAGWEPEGREEHQSINQQGSENSSTDDRDIILGNFSCEYLVANRSEMHIVRKNLPLRDRKCPGCVDEVCTMSLAVFLAREATSWTAFRLNAS